MSFQNSVGMSVDKFLSLLQFYLSATLVQFEDRVYSQRKGICIGSCVAPVLSSIFLSAVDEILDKMFDKRKVLKVFRYVDDFLIVLNKQDPSQHPGTVEEILEVFRKNSHGLEYTYELPQSNKLQFLDLELTLGKEEVHWMYNPRAQKELLSYQSAHSKTVKRGIASAALESAIKKSCQHCMQSSFQHQIERLKKAGYPRTVLTAIVESLLQKIKGKQTRIHTPEEYRSVRPVAIPYSHRVAHNLKKVANKYKVPVVFSAPFKLASLCPRINNSKENKKTCGTQHARPFVTCKENVVYQIPLSCNKIYIGQTGRCLNERLREHERSLDKGAGSNLAIHCKACGCVPRLKETLVLGRSRDKVARELKEAFCIKGKGVNCVSEPSKVLYECEISFLEALG